MLNEDDIWYLWMKFITSKPLLSFENKQIIKNIDIKLTSKQKKKVNL